MGAFQTIATDFGFHRKPFSNTDADFFFTNTGYLDAYVRLLDGVRQRCGLLILTGEAGTGKTLLLRKLAQESPVQIKFVCCYSTNLDFDDLLAVICDQLGIIGHGRERMHKLKALKDYLHTYSEQGVEVALLIDEAHLLSGDTLSRLLTLARLRVKEQSMLQVVLSGAPVLEEMLARHRALHAPLASAVHVHLDSLSASDVAGFIYRQLQSAGGPPPETLFPAPVTERIAGYTKGIPRLINMLCERALLLAQLNDQTTLSMALIDEAAEGLMLLRPESIGPQIKISPIATARPANNDPGLKSLEQAPVRIDKLSLDRVGPSLSRIAPVPGTDATPAISIPPGTSRESGWHGLFGARPLVILLAFLAGLLGGAAGAYLLFLQQSAGKAQLSLGAGTANPETAQVQAAAPPAPMG
jgi:type II secretory pathway predicted ATPase ExeA